MLYSVICIDKPDSTQLRSDTRNDHLEFLKTLEGRIKIGGPMMDAAEENMIGSLLVVEAESVADAKKMVAGDPYAQAGLFETVTIRPWKWTVGNPGV